jgi:hypothetical protein
MSDQRKPGLSSRLQAILLAGALSGLGACNGAAGPAPGPPAGRAVAEAAGPPLFRDRTPGSGVTFTYRNGEEAGHYALLESLGGGVALLDYDGDGRLDLFVTGGGYFDGPQRQVIQGHPNKLYRNLGNWKFQDVTREAGLDELRYYTHGCAVTDYDQDGWPDLLVTGWGRLALFHNEPASGGRPEASGGRPEASGGRQPPGGGRRFVEVTRQAGLTDDLWSTSAAWGDLDGDGLPDLYVCHYVNWSFANNPPCTGYTDGVIRDICPPKIFTALPHTLYRNHGDGTFRDVSTEAGLRQDGKGLGVLFVDVNDDRRPDIYVANDTTDNFLYLNRSRPGRPRFEEVGLPSGVARDDRGVADGSMGVDAADYDGSGRPSLWVTNYENEMHGLYRNQGTGFFLHSTLPSGIAAIGRLYVGFGTGFVDVDLDGWEDLVVTNGHVNRHSTGASVRQRPVLLRNLGTGRFLNLTRQGGPYFQEDHMGRGLAVGDLDNDGRPDLVISHVNEPVVLLQNDGTAGHHWLGVELVGAGHRDVVGAKLTLEAGGRRQTRFAKGGGSYLSASDPRHLFGLGPADQIDRLTVVWPSGRVQHWDGSRLALDRYHRLVEGEEAPPPAGGK